MGAQAEFCEKKTELEMQVFIYLCFWQSLREKVGTQCKNGPNRHPKRHNWIDLSPVLSVLTNEYKWPWWQRGDIDHEGNNSIVLPKTLFKFLALLTVPFPLSSHRTVTVCILFIFLSGRGFNQRLNPRAPSLFRVGLNDLNGRSDCWRSVNINPMLAREKEPSQIIKKWTYSSVCLLSASW